MKIIRGYSFDSHVLSPIILASRLTHAFIPSVAMIRHACPSLNGNRYVPAMVALAERSTIIGMKPNVPFQSKACEMLCLSKI
jgi:hypothetical protein